MLPHTVLFRLAFTVRVAFRTPRVSGTGDAYCISRGFTFLSNCMVQRMRVARDVDDAMCWFFLEVDAPRQGYRSLLGVRGFPQCACAIH